MAPRKKPNSRPYRTAFTQTSETLTGSARLLAKSVVDDFNALTPDYTGPITLRWEELSKQLYGVAMPLEDVLYYYAKVQNRPTPQNRADAVREGISYDIARMLSEDGVSGRYRIYSDNFDAFMRMASGDRREKVQEILGLRKEKNDVFDEALSGAGAIKPPPFRNQYRSWKQQWDDEMNRTMQDYLRQNDLKLNTEVRTAIDAIGQYTNKRGAVLTSADVQAAIAQWGPPSYGNNAQSQAKENETADQVAMNSFDPTPPDGYVLNWSATQQKALNDFVNAQQDVINQEAGRQVYITASTTLPVNQSRFGVLKLVINAWESALKTDLRDNYAVFRNTPMYTDLPPIMQAMLDDAVEQRLRGNQTRLAPDAEPATVGRRIELEFI